jgi:type I restriction enzyme S subunit
MRELFDVPIGLPKEAEQAAIVKRLDSASRHITATIKTAAKLRSLKAGLMQDLLTGRRRLTALLPAAGRDLEQAS